MNPTTTPSPWMPVVLASALFMELLDTAALGAALPTMAREFGTNPLHLRLALTTYLLTAAILMPASGWLAERLGARRLFVAAMALFVLGSVTCGFAQSTGQLVASRALQGVGGAMMTPVARMIVIAATPRAALIRALTAFTLPAIFGPLLGPVLAGFLLEVANWRWIFFINLPIGLIGIFAVLALVPRIPRSAPGAFDLLGFLTAGVVILSVLVVAESIGRDLWSPPVTGVAALVAVLSMTMLAWQVRRTPVPILDFRLLSRGTFRASMVGGSVARISIGATPFLMPLFLQSGLGWSPLRAGTVMTSMMAGAVVARYVGAESVRLLGFRRTLLWTAGATALFAALPAWFTGSTPLPLVVLALFGLGLVRAAHFVPCSALANADIAPEEVSRSSTLSTVIQQVTLGLGVSIAGLLLDFFRSGPALQLADFSGTFLALGLLSLGGIPTYLRLDRQAGLHMRSGALNHA
ncbi:MAG: MFS transporter [Steroidobacteraceae bacterium]